MIRRNAQTLQDVLTQVLHEQKLDRPLNELHLIDLWPEVVGTTLARQTDGLYIRQGTLYLHVRSAIVRNELLMMRDNLVRKLNEAVGVEVIRDIVLR